MRDPKFAFDLFAFGNLVAELLVSVDRFPGAGDGIHADQMLWTGGGMAGNLSHAVARLGGKVALTCAIGDDPLGDQIVAQLAQVGVCTDFIVRRENTPTPVTILMVDAELKRAGLVVGLPEGLELAADEVPRQVLASAGVFFTDMRPARATIMVAQKARHLGVPVAFDMQMASKHANMPGLTENANQLFALSDYFFADEDNFLYWVGSDDLVRAIGKIARANPAKTILITHGAEGSYIAKGSEMWSIPAFAVPVVDSIGAGDAYHGAFLFMHVILGWSLEAAGVFASATAALSCTKPGARLGLPTMDEVHQFLADQGVKMPVDPEIDPPIREKGVNHGR